jgi:hypothetical protein
VKAPGAEEEPEPLLLPVPLPLPLPELLPLELPELLPLLLPELLPLELPELLPLPPLLLGVELQDEHATVATTAPTIPRTNTNVLRI